MAKSRKKDHHHRKQKIKLPFHGERPDVQQRFDFGRPGKVSPWRQNKIFEANVAVVATLAEYDLNSGGMYNSNATIHVTTIVTNSAGMILRARRS